MPSSDSCRSTLAVMVSRFRSPAARPSLRSPKQVSQVSIGSVHARCPQPPRRVHPLHMLVASRVISGFDTFGRLATLTFVTRPNRVHACALRLTWPFPRALPGRSPRRTPIQLHGARAIAMTSTFQLIKSNRVTDAPKAQRKAEGSGFSPAAIEKLGFRFGREFDFAGLPHRFYRLVAGERKA
jgi:hypothetical protein